MIKNKIRFKNGFTIAELLIGILISAIIAAALVPIVGPKKIKAPLNRFSHGMAQCYYVPEGSVDANGNYPDNTTYKMYYFYTDNNIHNSMQKPQLVEGKNHCTFNAPNADFYEIITIGAGGDGYSGTGSSDFKIELGNNDVVAGTGYVHSDSTYEADINNAKLGNGINISAQLRALLNEWADAANNPNAPQNVVNKLYALYELKSPLGAAGTGKCIVKRLEVNDCQNKCRSLSDSNCSGPFRYDSVHYFGGIVNDDSEDDVRVYSRYGNNSTPQAGEQYMGSNSGINYSFYSPEEAEAAAGWAGTEDCWYYLHGKGYPSGKGIKTGVNNPLKLSLDGWSSITTKTELEETTVRLSNIKDPQQNIYLSLTVSGSGQDPYLVNNSRFEMPNYVQPSKSGCVEKGVSGMCENVNTTTVQSAPAGGSEYDGWCDMKISLPSRGSITAMYEGPLGGYQPMAENPDVVSNNNISNKANVLLEWKYLGQSVNAKFGHGGVPGDEQDMIFENIQSGKKLYMYPALQNSSYKYSYVATNELNPLNSILIQAASGRSETAANTSSFALFPNDLPIPDTPYSLAVPDNRSTFKYLSKIEGVMTNSGKNAGLKGCSDNDCPGFAGNGVYPLFDSAPDSYGMIIKNFTNGISYSGVSQGEANSQVIVNPKCKDDKEPVMWVTANYGTKTGKAYACKAKHSKGNPGAVIIVW